jgi:FxLD family lantipeptide
MTSIAAGWKHGYGDHPVVETLSIAKEVSVTVQMDQAAAPAALTLDSEFDLDVTLVEVADPGHLINMTDDGCGQTCEKSTCISAA